MWKMKMKMDPKKRVDYSTPKDFNHTLVMSKPNCHLMAYGIYRKFI